MKQAHTTGHRCVTCGCNIIIAFFGVRGVCTSIIILDIAITIMLNDQHPSQTYFIQNDTLFRVLVYRVMIDNNSKITLFYNTIISNL